MKALNEMSLKELETLQSNLTKEINKKTEEEGVTKRTDFLKSKDAVQLGAKMRELVKHYSSLSKLKPVEIEIKAKVKLEVEAQYDDDSLFDQVYSYSRDLEDLFGVNVIGEIVNTEFSESMKSQLQDGLNDLLDNACFDILNLSPANKESLDAFLEDFNNAHQEFEDNDLEDEDLEVLLKLKEEDPKPKKSRKKKS